MSFADLEAGRSAAPLRKRDGNLIVKSNPTQSISSCLFQINTAVSKFKRLVDNIGTHKDTPDLRHKLNTTRQHVSQLVKDTSAKLKQASELDHNAGVSEIKRINDVKLVKDFQTILNEYQKVQRLAVEREAASASSVMDISSDKTSDERALLVESKRQEIIVLDNEIAFNEAITEERDQGIQEIQQQIGDVNEIFKDLAVLVDKQGVMIEDISDHFNNSHAASAESKSLLKKASTTQRSSSSLACLLLVIFAVILLIVIIIVVA